MKEALENPYFKKIWEEVNWEGRHPEAKSLKNALDLEFLQPNSIIFAKNTKMTSGMYFARIEMLLYTKCDGISEEGVLKTILHFRKQNNDIILGRPITLFDVLDLLNTNKEDRIYIANGAEIHKIPDGKFCDFTTNLLEEQSEKTWEKIAELI